MSSGDVHISVQDDVAGIVVYAPSSAPAETVQMASTMAIQQLPDGVFEAVTPQVRVSALPNLSCAAA